MILIYGNDVSVLPLGNLRVQVCAFLPVRIPNEHEQSDERAELDLWVVGFLFLLRLDLLDPVAIEFQLFDEAEKY